MIKFQTVQQIKLKQNHDDVFCHNKRNLIIQRKKKICNKMKSIFCPLIKQICQSTLICAKKKKVKLFYSLEFNE